MLESLFVFSSSSCWWECVLGLEGTDYKAETGFEFFALDFQDLIPPLSFLLFCFCCIWFTELSGEVRPPVCKTQEDSDETSREEGRGPRDGGVQLGKVLPSARLRPVGVPPLGPTSAAKFNLGFL